jgi:RNA polymerase sigma-70 factor (ECF subfamily)
LRFEENLPIRAIAELWGTDAARPHHAYALARKEFRAALLAVLAFHQPGSPAELEQEAVSLLKALA